MSDWLDSLPWQRDLFCEWQRQSAVPPDFQALTLSRTVFLPASQGDVAWVKMHLRTVL